MKAFKVHNVETVKQEVNLPAGTYTYSFRVIPVGTSYTFRLDNQSFTFEGLTAGILNKRMKHTFELTEAVSFFYLSNTIGDCVYEPQIEEGVFATTPGAHPLDFERLISEAGIEIDHEALSLYAKKVDVSAEIKIQADEIKSTVGNISNDVDGVKGDMTTISQTVNSISGTVTNNTTQIAQFQYTVDQIYQSIRDVGSGEFAEILIRLDEIETRVGAPGQSGSIQVALDSIALTVYDENEGMAAISQKVNSISSTVYDEHGALLSQISQNGTDILIKGSQINLEGAFTANYNFKVLMDGSIEAKNGKFSGEINATSGSFTGTVFAKQGNSGMQTLLDASGIRVFNDTGQMNIRFGMKNGYAVLEYFDNAGKFLYDLGPNGIMKMEVREEKWTVFKRISLGTNMSTILASANRNKYKMSWQQTETTYYVYTSKISAGLNQDPSNDGAIFTSMSKTSPRMPLGFYCRKMPAGGVNMQYPNDGTNAIINSQLPYIQSGNENVYDRNIICFMDLEHYVNGKISHTNYYAYWNEPRDVEP